VLTNLAYFVHSGPSSDMPENIDYDFAQQELMLQQMEDDPIQVAIRSIEKQHEEDKQGGLLPFTVLTETRKDSIRYFFQIMSPR
jgi:kinesin family protein 13